MDVNGDIKERRSNKYLENQDEHTHYLTSDFKEAVESYK